MNGLLLAGKTNQSSISSDLEISSNSSETSSIEEHGNDYMVGGNEDEEYDDYENENEEDVETNNLDISPKVNIKSAERDCKRNFKWSSMQRGQCPIYKPSTVYRVKRALCLNH